MQADNAADLAHFASLAAGGAAAERALTALYDEYARRLLGLLRSKGFMIEEAEEILQEAFLKLYQARHKLADVETPKAYLYRTVLNCSTDFLRRKKKAEPEIGVEPDQLDSAAAPQSEDEGFVDCLQGALVQFEAEAPERALAIRLAVIEGMTGQELADAIGRSYGAAREFLSQTRKRFQSLLQELCGDYLPQEAVT